MKKVMLVFLFVLVFPYIISLFIMDKTYLFEKKTFTFVDNLIVRVKKEDATIEKISLENYIVGVLAGEMPLSFEKEALKAQAVAARSYVLKQMERNKNQSYDVVATTKHQVFLDDEYLRSVWKESYDSKKDILLEIIDETKGECVFYNDILAETLFFSTSTGKTENSEEVFVSNLPYLRSVDSKWDEISPVYETKKEYELSEFYKKLNLEYNSVLKTQITESTSTGRLKKIKINEKEFKAAELVSLLELKSTFFSITQKDNKIIIKNRGFGHGVGMSQYGALGMAREGYSYKEILQHYYQGTEIKKI